MRKGKQKDGEGGKSLLCGPLGAQKNVAFAQEKEKPFRRQKDLHLHRGKGGGSGGRKNEAFIRGDSKRGKPRCLPFAT